jgi:hypothetical protein
VKLCGSLLGADLDPASSEPGKLGGVRVAVDLDLSDCRGRQTEAILFDPVNQDTHIVGVSRPEELSGRSYQVPIQRGEQGKVFGRERNRVGVSVRLCRDLPHLILYRELELSLWYPQAEGYDFCCTLRDMDPLNSLVQAR